jgi:hypothetical protein
MEALPRLYRKVQVEPLLSKRAIRGFTAFIVLCALITLAPAFWVQGTPQIPFLTGIFQLSEQFAALPVDWMLMVISLCTGFLAIVILDQQLKKGMLRKKRAGSAK